MWPNLAELAPAYVRSFNAYVPSLPDPELMRQYGVSSLVRLNNNENALGPPPAAMEAMQRFPPPQAAVYPSGDCFHLRQALAERFGKHPDQFLVGNGSMEVISSVLKAFCGPGDNIVTADKTFAMYEWVAEFSGLTARLAPLRDMAFDPEALLALADGRTKVFFLCNPNNPTGTWWDRTVMARFLDQVGGRALVVLDEAYCEYLEDPAFPDGMQLLDRYPNLVVFRTFSKMYGLAGLRIGYLCASPEVTGMVRRTHVVYSVNVLAQTLALAALGDDGEHIRATRDMVRESRAALVPALMRLGLPHVAGEGNFVMARVPVPDTLMYRRLMMRGFMVRTMTGFRFPNWIRITLVRPPVMEAFTVALAAALGEG
jgi:histidinol-phosphate aminotransferase